MTRPNSNDFEGMAKSGEYKVSRGPQGRITRIYKEGKWWKKDYHKRRGDPGQTYNPVQITFKDGVPVSWVETGVRSFGSGVYTTYTKKIKKYGPEGRLEYEATYSIPGGRKNPKLVSEKYYKAGELEREREKDYSPYEKEDPRFRRHAVTKTDYGKGIKTTKGFPMRKEISEQRRLQDIRYREAKTEWKRGLHKEQKAAYHYEQHVKELSPYIVAEYEKRKREESLVPTKPKTVYAISPFESPEYEKRVESLMERETRKQSFYAGPGFERIKHTASLVTFGGGKPVERRGVVGRTAEQTVYGLMSWPLYLGAELPSVGGKIAATIEATTMPEYRASVKKELVRTGKEAVKVYKEPSTYTTAALFALPGAAALTGAGRGGFGIPRAKVTYTKFKVPTKAKEVVAYRGFGVELGKEGYPLVGVSKGRIKVGTPTIDISKAEIRGGYPYELVKTPTQTKIFERSLKTVAPKEEVAKFGLFREVVKKTETVPSRFVQKTFIREAKALSPRGVERVIRFARKEDATIYGSAGARPQMPLEKGRVPADFDVQLKVRSDIATKKAQELVTELKKTEGKGKVRISKKSETLIETMDEKGMWHHAVDIHAIDAPGDILGPTFPGEMVYGFKLGQKPIKIEKTKVMPLSEHGVRKGASIFTLRTKVKEPSIVKEPGIGISKKVPLKIMKGDVGHISIVPKWETGEKVILYHGTTKEAYPKIVKQGLVIGKKSRGFKGYKEPLISTTIKKQIAEAYAGETGKIIKIEIPKKEFKKLWETGKVFQDPFSTGEPNLAFSVKIKKEWIKVPKEVEARFAPEAHRMKDIPDFFTAQEVLLSSRRVPSIKAGFALKKLKGMYPEKLFEKPTITKVPLIPKKVKISIKPPIYKPYVVKYDYVSPKVSEIVSPKISEKVIPSVSVSSKPSKPSKSLRVSYPYKYPSKYVSPKLPSYPSLSKPSPPSPSISPSVSPSISPSVSPSISPSVSPSISISPSPYITKIGKPPPPPPPKIIIWDLPKFYVKPKKKKRIPGLQPREYKPTLIGTLMKPQKVVGVEGMKFTGLEVRPVIKM